jgi:hypothetical protein
MVEVKIIFFDKEGKGNLYLTSKTNTLLRKETCIFSFQNSNQAFFNFNADQEENQMIKNKK